MATSVTSDQKIIRQLNDLIELDFDAIEAYAAAIARLSDPEDKSQLGQFMGDHRRHVTDLTSIVEMLGAKAAAKADVKQVLTKGKVVIAGLLGERAVLEAMKSNEDMTNRVYEKATNEHGLPSHVREILERNLADERRHRAWLEQRIAQTASGRSSDTGIGRHP
jgi:uncharacterized protein (TIGR02284 family)